jgi:hypothetical protein
VSIKITPSGTENVVNDTQKGTIRTPRGSSHTGRPDNGRIRVMRHDGDMDEARHCVGCARRTIRQSGAQAHPTPPTMRNFRNSSRVSQMGGFEQRDVNNLTQNKTDGGYSCTDGALA